MIKVVRMIPGAFTPKEIVEHFLMTKKLCKGCGCVLNFWGKYPVDYHAEYCKYKGRF